MVLEGLLTIGLGREIDISEFLLLLLDHIVGDLDVGDLLISLTSNTETLAYLGLLIREKSLDLLFRSRNRDLLEEQGSFLIRSSWNGMRPLFGLSSLLLLSGGRSSGLSLLLGSLGRS